MTPKFLQSLLLSLIAVLSGISAAVAQAPATWVGRAVSYRVEVDADEAGRMQFTMRAALQRGGRARVTGCPDYAGDRVKPESCLLANGVGRWSVSGQNLCLASGKQSLCFRVRKVGSGYALTTKELSVIRARLQ